MKSYIILDDEYMIFVLIGMSLEEMYINQEYRWGDIKHPTSNPIA